MSLQVNSGLSVPHPRMTAAVAAAMAGPDNTEDAYDSGSDSQVTTGRMLTLSLSLFFFFFFFFFYITIFYTHQKN